MSALRNCVTLRKECKGNSNSRLLSLTVDMVLNLYWKILHQTIGKIWRGCSETTRAGRLHGIADVADLIFSISPDR